MGKRIQPVIEFQKSTMALAKWLEEGPTLDTIEQLTLENHLHVIQMVYSTWKRRFASRENTDSPISRGAGKGGHL